MQWGDVIYGPVESRRLGQSLGVNLTPLDLKVCNFSCGYCRVGVPSKGSAKPSDFKRFGWSLRNVKKAISTGLSYHSANKTPIDYITFAGNGEPTLYPWFKEIVNHLVKEKNLFLSEKPTAIFSNATTLNQKEVREAMHLLGRRFIKLDAGDEKTFKKINVPHNTTHDEIVHNLLSASNYELSMAVTNDVVSNYDSFFNQTFVSNFKKMQFTKLFIYDIDIPKTISPDFNKKTDKKKLGELARFFAKQLNKKVGKEIVILWQPTTRSNNIPLYPKQKN